MDESKPEPTPIPPKPIRQETPVEKTDAEGTKEEKFTPKTLFRKKMGADASIFVERKRKRVLPSGEKVPSFEQPHEESAPSSAPRENREQLMGRASSTNREAPSPDGAEPNLSVLLRKIGNLLLKEARIRFERIKRLPGIGMASIAAIVCLIFGFGVGRCSAPSASKTKIVVSEDAKKTEAETVSASQWYPNFEKGIEAVKSKNEAQVIAMAEAIANLKQEDTAYPAGWLYMRTKEREMAIGYLEKVPRSSRYASNAAMFQGILALREPGRVSITPKASKAEAFFKEALEIDPLNVDARMLYGVFLRKQSRNESAIEQFKTAMLLSRSSDASFIYGILLKLAENDVSGPPAEPPAKPDTADNIVASVNLWRNGSKAEALEQLRKTLSGLPATVQRTIVQDPAFKELPGSDSDGSAPHPSPQPSVSESPAVEKPTPEKKATPEQPSSKR